MRIHEIVAEEIGDTWATRHQNFQRQQAKRAKKVQKLDDAEAAASDLARTAAAARARSNDKIASAKRGLAATPET